MGRDQIGNLHGRLARLSEAYEAEVAKSTRMVELANEAWAKVRESEEARLKLVELVEQTRESLRTATADVEYLQSLTFWQIVQPHLRRPWRIFQRGALRRSSPTTR